jgi:4-diphosphocytidyl-2-C-methyl-D-erythritol kinase
MLTVKSPAKINWFLKVLGLRADGFHEIQSLIQKITLYDTLRFAPSMNLILDTNTSISTEQNLVYKAAALLKDRYDIKSGALINLEKAIPMGAGLGGGSSDAAATLLGLNELWSLNLSMEELCRAAEELGSDVPFFLYGAISFVCGRGEKIVPRKAEKTLSILLVKPSFDVSTAWAYGQLSDIRSLSQPELTKKAEKVNNIEHFIRNFEKAELSNIAGIVSNDLESVTIKSFPVIAEIKEMLHKQGAVYSLMSGSGPTVFGVFDSRRKAEEASWIFHDFWTAVAQTIID